MATKGTDESIPKENTDLDIEYSKSADSEADHTRQRTSKLNLDINKRFSTNPHRDNGESNSTDYIISDNTSRSSIPYNMQKVMESKPNCLDDTASVITSSSPDSTDIECISFTENTENKQSAHVEKNTESKREKIDSYTILKQKGKTTFGDKNINVNWNNLDSSFRSLQIDQHKPLNISKENTSHNPTKLNVSTNLFPMLHSQVSDNDYEQNLNIASMQLRSQKLRDKRDIIILHKHSDRHGVHTLRERIQALWNCEVQGNDIAIDLEMEVAVGLTEMTLDNTLLDVYRIILVYSTQSFDADVHRRFRMESILKESHKRGGNLSRRVIPLWIDVEPGHSQHIQLNILQGLSADSDTEIKKLLRLLALDNE